MKVIFILLLSLCLIIANSKRLIAPKPTLLCPGRCNCPTIYQPVCGKSGNTHGNACLAKCFKDVVAKVGACEPKCLKDQIKKKSSCKVEPYGRTGTRKYCCKWVEINGLKRNQICDYRGPATFISQKSSCKWKKLSATKRQRVCCNWTRTRVGKRVTNSKKTCKNVGEVVEINRKIGCRRRPFGKIGLRMFCCSHKTVCVGKACRIAQRVCNYRGDVFTERKIKRCKWHKKNAQQRQVRCCSFFQNCRVNPKTHKRKCLKRGKRCAWVGKVITSNTIKRCTLKPFGKNGLRNHCCSFEKRCNGKRCKHTNIRCGWEGCARYQRLKYSCSFVHVKKNTIRKQCCSWKETSICKTKRFSSKKCKWAGKPIITLTRNGCKWRQNGRNSRKLICCQYFRQYYGKKCHKTKKCVVKRIVRSVAHANCHWKKFGKYSKRRRCCSIQKRCEGVFSPIQLKTVRKVIYLNKKGKVTTRKESKRAARKARRAATRKVRKGRKVRRVAPRRKRRSLKKLFKRSLKRHLRRLRFSRKIRRSRGRKVRRNRRRASRRVRRARRGRKLRRNRRLRRTRRIRRRNLRRGRKLRRNRRLRRVRRNRRRAIRKGRKVNRRNRRRASRKVRRARRVSRKLRRRSTRRNRRRASRKVRRTRRGRKVNRKLRRRATRRVRRNRRATRKVRKVRRATRKGRKVRRARRASRKVRRTRRVVIHRPISWKCKVIKRSCKFAGQVVFKRLTKGCIWKKLNKFSRRRFCCKNKKVCVGKKCKTFKKCSYVGKIVKVSVRKSCSIQSYGNRSSRRKLCCQWKNYCTGIKKFKCRPIQKRCKWVGKIHQRIEKVTCKWEKKTRRQKQRYCCRWFRSCVTSKRGVQRNCQDGPKKCSWVGFIIKKSVKRLCNFKQVGKYGRRKYCCNHFRKCKGNKCKINRKGCKFYGPTYTRTPASNCHWKRINRRQKKRRCCYYFNYCVDKKCSSSKKHCKFVGKTITTSAFRRCYWKQVVQNGKYGRRRECCRFRKIKGSKGTRIIKKSCVFVGSMVALSSVYFKRDTKCTTTENRKTCCRRIHKCQIKNNKHGCTFYKNEKCVVTIVKVKLPSKPAICVSSGDPHYTTFNGKRFDYYKTGDFLLIESRGFTVHNRLRQWGGVSVNTGFAAKVNKAGETVESESRDGSEVTVNGKEKVKLNNGQKYYFKYGGYVHRIKNLLKVVSQSGDYMDVQCIPFNNGGNKNYQDHYYNIIVRVANKHKYATGFCVNPTPQKVSGLFSQAYNPSNQQPSKKCSVEKRAKVEKKCRDAGITSSRGIQRCIIDCCYNMKPIAERAREILKEEERLKPAPKPVKVVDPKPVKRQEGVCYSLGDPHYRTFAGKNFDNYWVGDFVLVSTKEFTVHARTRPWGRASVNKRIAANLNGDIVEAKSSDKFKLNGNTEVDLQVGQKIRLPKGGVVHRVSQTRVYYYSFKAGYLDADFIGRGKNRYVNLIVKVPHYPESSGACQGNMIAAHGLFQHEVKAQKGKKMKVSKDCHDRARVKCQKRGVQKRYIGSCIIDVCGGLGTKGIRSGVRHVKQDK